MLSFGTPSAGFIPARRYQFRYITDMESLDVPVRGVFPEGAPRAGAEYDLSPTPGTLLFGSILEALFAFGKYPLLSDNQIFVISAVEVEEETLQVIGRVVEFVKD